MSEFGDPTTQPFWNAAREHRLLVQRCGACGHHQFYPRPFCLACSARDPAWVEVRGTGTVYSLSTVYVAPSPEFAVPYAVAIVALDEGPKLMTNIVNGECRIGDRVRVAWQAGEGTPPLYMFEPAEA